MNIDIRKIEMVLAEAELEKATLAERCDMSRQSLYAIMKRGTCTPKTAGKLARGLGVQVSEIVEG